jgi:membrane fusion protein (multidrug efflux system)
LDRAQAGLALASANLDLAEARLSQTVVTAPFAGLVGQRRVDLGAYVQDGDTIVTLVDVDPLEIEFAVPERHVGRLAPGADITLQVTSHPGTTLTGEVTFIAPEVDPVNRTATVKARLPNPNRVLRPGQFASVELPLERRPRAVVVPEEAIVSDGEQALVYVVQDGVATARPVETGLRIPGHVEIRTGLTAGEHIVRTGHEKLDRERPTTVDGGGAG